MLISLLVENYRSPFKPRNRNEWYHSCLERHEAHTLLQQCQNFYANDIHHISYFLVRRSANNRKVYVLSLLYQGITSNFEISREAVCNQSSLLLSQFFIETCLLEIDMFL